jgi:hypothetical protein
VAKQDNRWSLEVLNALDGLMADDSNWGKGRRSYRDVRGHVRYCLVGAGHEAGRMLGAPRRATLRAMRRIRRTAKAPSVRFWNDRGRTQIQDVRRVVKESLAAEMDFRLPEDLVVPLPDSTVVEPATTDDRPATVWTARGGHTDAPAPGSRAWWGRSRTSL